MERQNTGECNNQWPPGFAGTQERVMAMRALNTNVLALNATMQALLARLGQSRVIGGTKATGNGKPEAGVPTGVMTNGHGVTLSDQDVPF